MCSESAQDWVSILILISLYSPLKSRHCCPWPMTTTLISAKVLIHPICKATVPGSLI